MVLGCGVPDSREYAEAGKTIGLPLKDGWFVNVRMLVATCVRPKRQWPLWN
jgi:hypothetical protein